MKWQPMLTLNFEVGKRVLVVADDEVYIAELCLDGNRPMFAIDVDGGRLYPTQWQPLPPLPGCEVEDA